MNKEDFYSVETHKKLNKQIKVMRVKIDNFTKTGIVVPRALIAEYDELMKFMQFQRAGINFRASICEKLAKEWSEKYA